MECAVVSEADGGGQGEEAGADAIQRFGRVNIQE
jgi:hypothetical protein